MSHEALGLIETTNLASAMEASTAASHAATVLVSSVTLIDAQFVVVKVEGELAQVNAAIASGADAAQMTGSLISARVISKAVGSVNRLATKKRSTSAAPTKRIIPKPRKATEAAAPRTPSRPQAVIPISGVGSNVSMAELEEWPVTKLRQYARSLAGLPIQGRQISMANKQQLLEAIAKTG
jgi:ethanolamine utilization protein EutM